MENGGSPDALIGNIAEGTAKMDRLLQFIRNIAAGLAELHVTSSSQRRAFPFSNHFSISKDKGINNVWSLQYSMYFY